MASQLLDEFEEHIGQITLVTGKGGAFEVTLDGELIYSKHATGRHAEAGEVLSLFRDAYANGVSEYGT